MKIAYLGTGAWGFALISLLASKGYSLKCWTVSPELAKTLNETGEHPNLKGYHVKGDFKVSTDLDYVLEDADLIVESVTSKGIRPVFQKVLERGIPECPIILTSKGIEQKSGLILPDVVIDVLGSHVSMNVGLVSGPSYAKEVIKGLPASVVGTAYNYDMMTYTCQTFQSDRFRVYPNIDIRGVSYGGALKNIIAISCGIAEGLGLGHSSRAALMTRGLHEIKKLAVARGCKAETLYGLSGMGDLCVTCSADLSRNFRFGVLIAHGHTVEEAKKEIGMVVEGAYSTVSALQLSQESQVEMPITETVHKVIIEGMSPKEAIPFLMQRVVKEEHL